MGSRMTVNGNDQSKSVMAARDTFNTLYDISQILNTGLAKEELILCVRLCEKGVDPVKLASVVTAMKKEFSRLEERRGRAKGN